MARMAAWMDEKERDRRKREYQAEYRKKHRKEAAESVRRHRERKRKQKILSVAPECHDCGEDHLDVLTVVDTLVLCLNCKAIRQKALTKQESVVPLAGYPVKES